MSMDETNGTFAQAVKRIMSHYDTKRWWPHESRFEIMVGAILVQRTRWENVEKAIEAMMSRGVLTPSAISSLDILELERLVRPTGFFRQKSRRVQRLAHHIHLYHKGDVTCFLERPPQELASDLERMDGIGPETRDAILLYAAGHPVMIVDTYAIRLCDRLGLLDPVTPHTIKNHLMQYLPTTPQTCRRAHAAIVEHGKERCCAVPRCSGCPLLDMCEHGATT